LFDDESEGNNEDVQGSQVRGVSLEEQQAIKELRVRCKMVSLKITKVVVSRDT